MSAQQSAPDRLAAARAVYLKAALSYGGGVWDLIQAGRRDLADDCAFQAWAAMQAAEAEIPWRRHKTLIDEHYGNDRRERLRLAVDNTREVQP